MSEYSIQIHAIFLIKNQNLRNVSLQRESEVPMWLRVKNPPAKQETQVWSLGWEDPLEEEMANRSSILAWKNPMDRGTWWARVHGVAKGLTWLSVPAWMESRDSNSRLHGHLFYWLSLGEHVPMENFWTNPPLQQTFLLQLTFQISQAYGPPILRTLCLSQAKVEV